MDFYTLEQLPNFPCFTCPFVRKIEDNGNTIPFCSIYSNQEGCGIESCQEIASYIIENGNKEKFLESFQNHKLILNY
jgi:hypothetical protein